MTKNPLQETAWLQHTGLSLSKGESSIFFLKLIWTGLWSFRESQLPPLLLAAEEQAGRLLPKPVEEGADWKQVREEWPHPLKPDPWCSQGKYLSGNGKQILPLKILRALLWGRTLWRMSRRLVRDWRRWRSLFSCWPNNKTTFSPFSTRLPIDIVTIWRIRLAIRSEWNCQMLLTDYQ